MGKRDLTAKFPQEMQPDGGRKDPNHRRESGRTQPKRKHARADGQPKHRRHGQGRGEDQRESGVAFRGLAFEPVGKHRIGCGDQRSLHLEDQDDQGEARRVDSHTPRLPQSLPTITPVKKLAALAVA